MSGRYFLLRFGRFGVDGPSTVSHPCVRDHSVCLELEKDFCESVILVRRKRKQQNRTEEFMDQHENKPASAGKAKFYWRLRWELFLGVAGLIGIWII